MSRPTPRGELHVKAYSYAIEALHEWFVYLDGRGEFNSRDIQRKLIEAGIPKEYCLSDSMIRMIKYGMITRVVEQRAVACARALGVNVTIVNPNIPADYKAASKKKAK